MVVASPVSLPMESLSAILVLKSTSRCSAPPPCSVPDRTSRSPAAASTKLSAPSSFIFSTALSENVLMPSTVREAALPTSTVSQFARSTGRVPEPLVK